MATLKDLLPQIPKDELAILRDLNSKLDESKLTEATAKEAAQAVKEIIQNWKSWSKITLAAMLLVPNISNALETYSPNTLNAIKTEISATNNVKTDTVSKKIEKVPGSVLEINFNQTFPSGQAKLTNGEALQTSVNEIQNFLKGKDTSKFKIVIVAGESQVTNPKGFEKKGSLAQARAKAVEGIVSKLGFGEIEIKTQIGDTPYQKGDNVNDKKFTEEQFVTVNIVINNDICSMESVNVEAGQGVESKNYVTFDEYLNGKGNLLMSTGTIPDRLVVLDVNGNIKQDTGYTTTRIKDGDWQYTPLYVLELTKAYMKGNISMKGIDPKTIITVKDKYDLYNKLKKATVNNPSLEGSEVKGALKEMEEMIKKGINTFVIYNIGTSNIKLNFDDSKGDIEAKVYSPIGKTAYSIGASCNR